MFGRLLRLAALAGLSAMMVSGDAREPAPQQTFRAAYVRGELIVGILYLEPTAVAGVKIRTPERLKLPLRLRQIPAEHAKKMLEAGHGLIPLSSTGPSARMSSLPNKACLMLPQVTRRNPRP